MADLTLKIGGDSSEAISEAERLKRELRQLREAIEGVGDQASTNFRKAGRALEDFGTVRREVFRELQTEVLEEIINDGSIANTLVRAFHNLRDASIAARAPIGQVGTSLDGAGVAAGRASGNFLGLSRGMVAAGAAVGGIVVVAGVAVGALLVLVNTTQAMVDTATKLGTKSKDDFDKFKKSVIDAGLSVTQLDRNLSQGIVAQVEALKAASDGLFIDVLRNAGPQFIVLLRRTIEAMRELQPLISLVGSAVGETFNIASAALSTITQLLGLAKENLLAFLLTVGNLPIVTAIFKDNLAAARAEAEKLSGTLKTATFDTKGAGASEDSIRNQIALLRVREQEAQRIYGEEIAAAGRAYDARAISAEAFYSRQLAAEQKLLAAKLATITTERELVARETGTQEEKAVRLAELQEQQLQLLSDYRQRSIQLKSDQLKSETEEINQTLTNSRKVAEQRLQLRRELAAIALETKQLLLEAKSITLAEDEGVNGDETRELEQRRQLLIEEASLQSESRQNQIRFAIEELEFADLTYAQRLEKEKAFNAQLIAERRRLGIEIAAINNETRAQALQNEGFTESEASAIAAAEAAMERQATASEKLRISLRNTAIELSKTIPSGAALAAQAFRVLGAAMAQSIGAFVSGQASFRQALGQMVKAVFDSLAQVAIAKGAEQFAWGLSDLAIGNFGGAAKHFAAGAAWSALGGLVGAVGGAIAGGGGAGAGGLSQQLTGTTEPTTVEERTRFRDGSGLASASTSVTITLRTDQQQIVDNVEFGARSSFANGGTIRKLLDSENKGFALDS